MKKNEGKLDRIIRVVLAVGFAALAIWVSPWFWIGTGILLFTAATGTCLLYLPFGIDTTEKQKKE